MALGGGFSVAGVLMCGGRLKVGSGLGKKGAFVRGPLMVREGDGGLPLNGGVDGDRS